MKPIHFLAAAIASALVFSATSCTETHHDHATPIVAKVGLKNLKQPRPFILVSGQPTQEQLDTLASEGVKHVVNLRPASEQSWSEQKKVQSLGMKYISIPVSGADDLTVENARKLDAALTLIGKEPALIHCASGNRVGALMAISEAKLKGKSDRAAIRTGKKWGLTKLEPVVRKKLKTL